VSTEQHIIESTTQTLDPECRAESTEDSELKLDLVTRERLAVAAVAADTLEGLSSNHSWEQLDPTLARHLRRHAQQLAVFLERVQAVDQVKDCESELMAMRRTQRRLEVALELLEEEEQDKDTKSTFATEPRLAAATDLFMGDFTNAEVDDVQKEVVRGRRQVRKEKKRKAKRTFRLGVLAFVAVVVVAASLAVVSVSDFGKKEQRAAAVSSNAAVPNRYLQDIQAFLPATQTFMTDGAAMIQVSRDWANKSLVDRKRAAAELQVFLANRGVPKVILSWKGGSMLAMGKGGEEMKFLEEMGLPLGGRGAPGLPRK
jgi:hypothetical protein